MIIALPLNGHILGMEGLAWEERSNKLHLVQHAAYEAEDEEDVEIWNQSTR